MIQRTLFNKLTLDRIEELFVPYFAGVLEPQLQAWREAVTAGEVAGREFYISFNEQWEMDGILRYDENIKTGVIYARTPEAARQLLTRVRRSGAVEVLTGDFASCQWARQPAAEADTSDEKGIDAAGMRAKEESR